MRGGGQTLGDDRGDELRAGVDAARAVADGRQPRMARTGSDLNANADVKSTQVFPPLEGYLGVKKS